MTSHAPSRAAFRPPCRRLDRRRLPLTCARRGRWRRGDRRARHRTAGRGARQRRRGDHRCAAPARRRDERLPAAPGQGPRRGEAGVRVPGRCAGLHVAGGKEPRRRQADLRQRQTRRQRLPGDPQAARRQPRGRRELHRRDRAAQAGRRQRAAIDGARLARQAERQGRRLDPGAGKLPRRGRQPGWHTGRHHRRKPRRHPRRRAWPPRGHRREERLHHDQAGVHARIRAEPAAQSHVVAGVGRGATPGSHREPPKAVATSPGAATAPRSRAPGSGSRWWGPSCPPAQR